MAINEYSVRYQVNTGVTGLEQMRGLADTMASIKSAYDGIKNIKGLGDELTALNESVKGSGKMKTFSQNLQELTTTLSSLSATDLKAVTSFTESITAMKDSMSGLKEVEGNMRSFKQVIKSVSTSMQAISDLKVSGRRVSKFAANSQKLAAAFSEMGKAQFNTDNIENFKKSITTLKTAMNNVGKIDWNVLKKAEGGGKALGNFFQQFSKITVPKGFTELVDSVKSLRSMTNFFKNFEGDAAKMEAGIKKFSSALDMLLKDEAKLKRIAQYGAQLKDFSSAMMAFNKAGGKAGSGSVKGSAVPERALKSAALYRLQGGMSPLPKLSSMPFAYMLSGFYIFQLITDQIKQAVQYTNVMQTAKSILLTHDGDLSTFEERFKELGKTVRKIGVQTKYTALEVGEATKFLAMAGLNVSQIKSAMPAVANLALIGDDDLGTIADYMTNIVTGYGLKNEDMSKASDIMAYTTASANTNMVEMAEAFKMSAGIMSLAKIPFEEAAASVGILANAGIKGTMAGTSLRAIAVRLVKPTAEARKELDKLGVSFTKIVEGSDGVKRSVVKNLTEIFQELRSARGGRGATLEQLQTIFGKIAGNGAMNLMAHVDELGSLSIQNQNSDYTAAILADKKQNTTQGLWAKTTSAFTEAFINTYEELEPQIQDALRGLIDTFSSDSFKEGMLSFGETIFAIANTIGQAVPLIIKHLDLLLTYYKGKYLLKFSIGLGGWFGNFIGLYKNGTGAMAKGAEKLAEAGKKAGVKMNLFSKLVAPFTQTQSSAVSGLSASLIGASTAAGMVATGIAALLGVGTYLFIKNKTAIDKTRLATKKYLDDIRKDVSATYDTVSSKGYKFASLDVLQNKLANIGREALKARKIIQDSENSVEGKTSVFEKNKDMFAAISVDNLNKVFERFGITAKYRAVNNGMFGGMGNEIVGVKDGKTIFGRQSSSTLLRYGLVLNEADKGVAQAKASLNAFRAEMSREIEKRMKAGNMSYEAAKSSVVASYLSNPEYIKPASFEKHKEKWGDKTLPSTDELLKFFQENVEKNINSFDTPNKIRDAFGIDDMSSTLIYKTLKDMRGGEDNVLRDFKNIDKHLSSIPIDISAGKEIKANTIFEKDEAGNVKLKGYNADDKSEQNEMRLITGKSVVRTLLKMLNDSNFGKKEREDIIASWKLPQFLFPTKLESTAPATDANEYGLEDGLSMTDDEKKKAGKNAYSGTGGLYTQAPKQVIVNIDNVLSIKALEILNNDLAQNPEAQNLIGVQLKDSLLALLKDVSQELG